MGVRDKRVRLNLFSHFLARASPSHADFEAVVSNAVHFLDLIVAHRRGRACWMSGQSLTVSGRRQSIRELWLGRRRDRCLTQPDDFDAPRVLRSRKLRYLLTLRQMILERRLDEAARVLDQALRLALVPPTSLLWRAGFHLLVRTSVHRPNAARWTMERQRAERASVLDRFMIHLGKMAESVVDRENMVLEYVLHCLADQDIERAVHVMSFLKKDSPPTAFQLSREPEAATVYHLRQCYIGLAYATRWTNRVREAEKANADEQEMVEFEAANDADLALSYLESSLAPLIDAGQVVDVFLPAFCKLCETKQREEEAGQVLRRYAVRVDAHGGSPNAHRLLAEWSEDRRRHEAATQQLLKAARAAPDDWALVSSCLRRLQSGDSARLDLLFAFLDHPRGAARPDAWEALGAELRRAGGDGGRWAARAWLWTPAYFSPRSAIAGRAEVAAVAALLRARPLRAEPSPEARTEGTDSSPRERKKRRRTESRDQSPGKKRRWRDSLSPDRQAPSPKPCGGWD